MNIKQKVFQSLITLSLLIGLSSLSANTVTAANCAGKETLIIDCDPETKAPTADTNGDNIVDDKDIVIENNGVWKLLIVAINILTAGIGIAGVGGIVYGAIRYATAGGNFENAKKALGVITNVGIGLVAYALMYAVLNFIIPGGLFT